MLLKTLLPLLLTLPALLASPQYKKPTPQPPAGFVYPKGRELFLDGKKWYFAGTNTYYLYYAEREDVDALFADAKKLGLKVVRTWLFSDGVGDEKLNEKGEIIWFQRMNTTTKQIEYNDNVDSGIGRFDYVIASAKKHGIKVLPVFTNNWRNFGGIDWYVGAFNQTGHQVGYHSDFYQYEPIKAAYKKYVSWILNRTNTITKTKYKDDPTIFGWELVNEPRCKGDGTPWSTPNPAVCSGTSKVIVNWVDEMSTHLKSLSKHHLVLVGDEGYFNRPSGPSYNYCWSDLWDGSSGSDFEAFLKLPNIDVGTFHSYFDDAWVQDDYQYYNQNKFPGADLDPYFSNNTLTWIREHDAAGKKIGKPVILEEIGVPYLVGYSGYNFGFDERRVNDMPKFNDAVYKSGLAGSLYWQLNSKWKSSPTGWYQGVDSHSVFINSPEIDIVITNHAKKMASKNK